MGYTHYYYLNRCGNEQAFEQAKKEIGHMLSESKLVDKTAKPDNFNGIGEEAHETFWLPKTLREQTGGDDFTKNNTYHFHFCKTARKDYDILVVASLVILKNNIKDDIELSSDGDFEEWHEGMELAKKYTKFRKTLVDDVLGDLNKQEEEYN